eukprot:CAMPEP_0174261480 /NCGR_PEP_ID=MMETSP0439-20130205/11456_1 /TAXON_ID=0 /ORGANISM="Stereomyxa ramosa, Strain Chinc5" /LENGTH=153 /DNA_ID=CAMNT_0015345961 /DNA_START=24 /DNA_END=485 /DNA_ORIENTATION=+
MEQDAVSTVKNLLACIENNDRAGFVSLLDDNFTLRIPPLPDTLSKEGYEKYVFDTIKSAIPNWKYEAKDFTEETEDNGIVVHVQIEGTGTHSGDALTLPFGSVDASGAEVRLPEEPCHFVVDGGKITSVEVDYVQGGGPGGIFVQCGGTIGNY